MLNAVAIQASSTRTGNVAQTMLIPAARLRFGRIISEAHPRSQWKALGYTGAILPAGLDSTLKFDWTDRAFQQVSITTDPIGFQVTDEEYLEIRKTGELPRNVTLRYQRALESKNAVLVGKRAEGAGPDSPYFLGGMEQDTALDRLAHAVEVFADRIEALDHVWLAKMTPQVARCKGDNRYRNSATLPSVSDAPEPVAPVVEPVVPAAFVKPEPVVPAPVVLKPEPVSVGAKLIRPNGEVYVARKVDGEAGLSDVEMYRRAVRKGWNVLAFGVPGTGKTAAFEVAFPGLITLPGTADTETADFLGQHVQIAPGEYLWVDGPLVVAMETGNKLLVDEIGLIDTRQLAVLYSVMDGRREINITMNPQRGTVVAREGFGIVAATNPDAPGVRLSEALLSRFGLMVEVTTDFTTARALGVNERLCDAAEHFDTLRQTGELSWAPQFRELLAAKETEEEFGMLMALRALINQAPAIERDIITAKLKERFGDIAGVRRLKGLGI